MACAWHCTRRAKTGDGRASACTAKASRHGLQQPWTSALVHHVPVTSHAQIRSYNTVLNDQRPFCLARKLTCAALAAWSAQWPTGQRCPQPG